MTAGNEPGAGLVPASATAFDGLLPPAAVVVEAGPPMWQDGLRPAEAAWVDRAVPKRRREFTAGRNCARAAMARLGLNPPPDLLVGPHREPLFPVDLTGSITHTDTYCAAAVMPRGPARALGIDAADLQTLPAELAALVLHPDEHAVVDRWAGGPVCPVLLLFSIKEAFYKAFFQIAGRFLDGPDLCVQPQPEPGCFRVQVRRSDLPAAWIGTTWPGRFRLQHGRVHCAVVL